MKRTSAATAPSARQAAVSQQLSRLRLEGLVQPRRDGKTIYYSLTDDRSRAIDASGTNTNPWGFGGGPAGGLIGQGAFSAGQVRHWQVFYRDNGGPCGSGQNMTNGLTVVIHS